MFLNLTRVLREKILSIKQEEVLANLVCFKNYVIVWPVEQIQYFAIIKQILINGIVKNDPKSI